jgi:hypothetical protein
MAHNRCNVNTGSEFIIIIFNITIIALIIVIIFIMIIIALIHY